MDAIRDSPGSSSEQLRQLYRFMAVRQFVASREELVSAGFNATRVENWIRNGRLIKIVRSVYSYGRDVETREAVFRAALLAAGQGAALVGKSACEVWGIAKPEPGLPATVEVGSPDGQSRQFAGRSPALRGTTFKVVKRDYGPADLRTMDGLNLTRAALSLIDFAASASDREVRFAFLEACRLGHFGAGDLTYCYETMFNRRGAGKIRPYLALWVPELNRIRSVLEGWFLLVWVAAGYPIPKVNVKIFGYEVDCYWPEKNLALELDGHAFHSDLVAKRLDLEKQQHLEAQGVTVKRLTFREFESDPEGVVHRTAAQMGFRPASRKV